MYRYPVVIHKDPKSDYSVAVPDLPGCVSAGRDLDEALTMVREAIELHLEGMIEDGVPAPHPSRFDDLVRSKEFAGGTWAVVEIDETSLRVNIKRIGVTIPERILDAIDAYAHRINSSRSALIARAASQFIGRDSGREIAPAPGGSKVRRIQKASLNKGKASPAKRASRRN